MDLKNQLQGYTLMRRIRAADDRLQRGIREGDFDSLHYSVRGQEAICGALGLTLEPADYSVSTYRALGDLVARGAPLPLVFAEILGKRDGLSGGKGGPMHMSAPEQGVLATTGVVGSGLPIAAGLGFAARYQGPGRLAAVTFGDGATSTGAFHEGLSLIGLWRLPVLLICINNQYALHTSVREYAPVQPLARKADSYSIPSETVDGFDLASMVDVLSRAAERARAGQGATFIECQIFRLHPHMIYSDMAYVDATELNAAEAAEPVARLRDHLAMFTPDAIDKIDGAVAEEVETAYADALAGGEPPASVLTTDIYADGAGTSSAPQGRS